jgi:hypothetical protein
MTPEGRVEAYLRKAVKREGGTVRKIRWIGRRNAPDNLFWFGSPLRQALVECKRDDATDPTLAQMREHRLLRNDGWPVYVVGSPESIERMIKEVKHGHKA